MTGVPGCSSGVPGTPGKRGCGGVPVFLPLGGNTGTPTPSPGQKTTDAPVLREHPRRRRYHWPAGLIWHCHTCRSEVKVNIPVASPPPHPCPQLDHALVPLSPYPPQIPGQLDLGGVA